MTWEWTKNLRGAVYSMSDVLPHMTLHALKHATVPVTTYAFEGFLENSEELSSLTSPFTLVAQDQLHERNLYGAPKAFLEIEFGDDGHIAVHYVGYDEKLHQEVEGWCQTHLLDTPKSPVLTLETGVGGRPQLRYLGFAARSLVRDNYTPGACAAYDKVVKAWSTEHVSARLCILTGPPGTGKTNMVRGMMHDLPAARFVIIPHSMLDMLGSPSLVGVLSEAARNGTPLIFVLEDADDVLVPRSQGNMHLISALLNLGDGILGSALNLSIICTTNRQASEIDPAIVRPGRLAGQINLTGLGHAQAKRVLHRLNPNAALPPPTMDAKSVGFGASHTSPTWALANLYEAANGP